MTIVLLHGVPETAEIWDDVRERLDAPSVALQLPGFACPRPDGFAATKDAYVDWLVEELKQIDGPIDLVGHDWGGGFSLRIGQHYPELVRSWVSDVAGIAHPDYVWHDIAQIWQTPETGEAFFENQGSPEDRAALLQGFGLNEKAALKLARMGAEIEGSCILDLYRSATPNPNADWPDTYAKATKPCLFMMPSDDPFTGGHLGDDVAAAIGAQSAKFASNHFWPLQVPEVGATTINEFVASVG
jgi:pimeloyl-ACP methyl ester carboxylesterase